MRMRTGLVPHAASLGSGDISNKSVCRQAAGRIVRTSLSTIATIVARTPVEVFNSLGPCRRPPIS
jgi:hypothetical protein